MFGEAVTASVPDDRIVYYGAPVYYGMPPIIEKRYRDAPVGVVRVPSGYRLDQGNTKPEETAVTVVDPSGSQQQGVTVSGKTLLIIGLIALLVLKK